MTVGVIYKEQKTTRNQKIHDWANKFGQGILIAGLLLEAEELENEQDAHETTKQKLNNLQNELNSHVCSGAGNPGSPGNDSSNSQIIEERIKVIRKDSEQQIVQSINQELNLGLNNPTLEQVIVKIKELNHKPPTSSSVFTAPPSNQTIKKSLQDAQQTILRLEKELSEKSTPFGEDLAVIKQLELNSLEELFKQAVDSAVIQQIQQATNYQQVVAIRQAFLQKHLGQKEENTVPAIVTKNELVQSSNKERVILISLLVSSLIGMGRLLVKLRSKNKKGLNK